MVILTLLGLILEVIRLTVEVMDKNSQKKNDDNKKDWPPQAFQTERSIFWLIRDRKLTYAVSVLLFIV